MGEAVSVRMAQPEDVAALAGLIAGFRDHLGLDVPTDAAIAAALPDSLRDDAMEFALAFTPSGTAVGYAWIRYFSSLWVGGVEVYLEDIFVDAAARRTGAGRALMDFVLERSRARGAKTIGLITNERNESAQALYREVGYELEATPAWPGGREVRWFRKV